MPSSVAGITGLTLLLLSFVLAMVVVGDELGSSDYRGYGADWPCVLSAEESDLVYHWSLSVLFMWLLTQGIAAMRYMGAREYFDANVGRRNILDFLFVTVSEVYLGSLFVLAALFEWGLTCNNYNRHLDGSSLLWGACVTHIAGVACMHAMPKKKKTTDTSGEEEGAVIRRLISSST